MEPRQAHGSRQFQYSSIPTSSTTRSKPTPTTTAAASSSSSTSPPTTANNNTNTHRRQRSEPASTSSGRSSQPSRTLPSSNSVTSNPTPNGSSNRRSNPAPRTSSIPRHHHQDSNPPTQSKRSDRSPTTPSTSNVSSSSSSNQFLESSGTSKSSTQPHNSSQTRTRPGDSQSRSRRNDNPDKSSTSSSQSGVRGERSHSESRSRNHKDDRRGNRKTDASKDGSIDRDFNSKESGGKSSNSKEAKTPGDQGVESKSKDSTSKKGKPSHTPKIKRRPRASSATRQSPGDDGGGGDSRWREHNSQSGDRRGAEVAAARDSSTSSSNHDAFHHSSRLPPEASSSSSSSRNAYDKVTPTDSDRRTIDRASTRDESDTRSVKSEKSSRSKRATSAPREVRSGSNARDRNVSEERKNNQSRGSISYHQLPKSMTTSMQNNSSRKHKSLLDVSERQASSNNHEEEISLQDLNSPQYDNNNKHKAHRYSYQTLRSSHSVPNSSDPSKFYARSDREISSSSSKSPKSFHRKQNSNTSDATMTSDSERSTRGPSVSSAEEPLLPKSHASTTSRQNSDPRSNRRSLPSPNVQTFPRMKTQKESPKKSSHMYPMATATVDRHQTGKTQFLLDRIRNFSTNQIPSQEPYFSPLHQIPSQSSLSSDNRSEVCLDLPDMPEDADDYYNTGLKPDVNIKSRFPIAVYQPIQPLIQPRGCTSFLLNFLKFLASFLLLWPLLVVVIVFVPFIFFVKKFFSWCCCCGRSLWGRCCVCLCHTHLSSSESIWLGGRGLRSNPVVQSLVVVQRGLDTDRIRHLIDSRILFVENRRGRKLYPRFTQKVVQFCCGQAWMSDRSFVTSNHVFNMPGYIETLDDLQQFISKMASEPLSLSHPLWEVQVLHNFREPRDTVLLFRMHMSMTDGVSMVHVLQHALVDSTKPSSTKATFSDEAANTSPFKVMLAGPLTFLSRYVFRRDDFNLLHGGHFEASGESVVAWSEPFSLSAALRVKQVARCTLADLLLSITAGNIRTYLQVCGIRHPYDVTCAVPVDFQSMDMGALDMENKYTLVHLPLPTNTEGAIPRLWAIKHIMEHFKGSAEAAIVSGARWLTHALLPVSCFQSIWRKVYSRATLLLSNLAGPTSVLKLDSREIKCMMYWLPPLDKVAVTISFFTYADQIRMAVISDRSALPNPELLTRDFIYKLETLSKLLAHRRIPGESSYSSRHENVHLLSSFTLDDLTADQIQLEMSLVQQELHDLKVQLDSGPTDQISHQDHQLMDRIEALKERSSELMMHLRKRKAEESESAVILSEEGEDLTLDHLDNQSRPFRRRTLSMSSRLSTTSVTSTARPLSTASTSNLMTSNHPSPTHQSLPSWPEAEFGMEDSIDDPSFMRRPQTLHRFPHRPDPELDSPEHQTYRSTSQHLLHSATASTNNSSTTTTTINPHHGGQSSYRHHKS